MPIADIAFLAMVVTGFTAFAVTLAATAWYCRDRPAARPIPAPAARRQIPSGTGTAQSR